MNIYRNSEDIPNPIPLNSAVNGDCLEIMAKIPDKSIDMVLCDLPYGTIACKWDQIIPFEPLWSHYERIIKDNGAIILTASQPFTSLLVASNLKLFKYELIWCKEQGNQPQLCNIQPMKAHENILVFGKGRLKYNPQFTIGTPYNKKQPPKIQNLRHCGQTKFTGIAKVNSTKRYPISYLKFPCDRTGLHPTQKPLSLFEYLLKTYSDIGDTILDNTAGSFTTAVASINLHRNFIVIEKDPDIFQIGVNRVHNTPIPLNVY